MLLGLREGREERAGRAFLRRTHFPLITDIGLATYLSWIAYEDLQYGKEVQLIRDLYYRFVNDSSAMMLTIKSRNL